MKKPIKELDFKIAMAISVLSVIVFLVVFLR